MGNAPVLNVTIHAGAKDQRHGSETTCRTARHTEDGLKCVELQKVQYALRIFPHGRGFDCCTERNRIFVTKRIGHSLIFQAFPLVIWRLHAYILYSALSRSMVSFRPLENHRRIMGTRSDCCTAVVLPTKMDEIRVR